MNLSTGRFIDGRKVLIIVRSITERRLSNTCFRGIGRPLAGNFSRWGNATQLFGDKLITSMLVEDAERAICDGSYSWSISYDIKRVVGWSSTDDLVRYRPEDLTRFSLNSRATGLKVGPDFMAPKTSFVTLSCEVKIDDVPPQVVVIVHSIYPGRDIGGLVGDVSNREGIAFFDWDAIGK